MKLQQKYWYSLVATAGVFLSLPVAGNAVGQMVPEKGSGQTEAAPQADVMPFLVFVHSKQCNVCAKVRPVLQELEKTYKNKVQFIYLDVTDDKSKEESRKMAKSLSLGAFFAFYEDTYPCVGIFSSKKKCLKELYGYHEPDKYTTFLDKALSSP